MNVPERHRAAAHAWVDGARIGCRHMNTTDLSLDYTDIPQWLDTHHYEVMPVADSIDWSHVAEKYIATVTHPSGNTMCVTDVPYRSGDVWRFDKLTDSVWADSFASFKRGTTEWQDSLVLRADAEQELKGNKQ